MIERKSNLPDDMSRLGDLLRRDFEVKARAQRPFRLDDLVDDGLAPLGNLQKRRSAMHGIVDRLKETFGDEGIHQRLDALA